MVSHVCSIAWNGRVKWLWSRKNDESRTMGIKDLAIYVQTKIESWRRFGGVQEENVMGDDGQTGEDEITDDCRENAAKMWKDGGVLVMKALRSILEW